MSFEVIGLSGKAGSGKDWIAQNIYRKEREFYPSSLAWHFKVWAVGQKLCTFEEAFYTKPPQVRNLLQRMGTEEGRDVYGEGIWVDTMFAWFQLYHDMWGFTKFVVPDVRFRNELAGIQAHGGKVYRIIAPKRVALSPLTEEQRQHPSETDLDGVPLNQFDGVIYNDPEHATSLRMQIHQLNGEPANDDSGEFLVDIFSEVESFANKIFRGKKS